GQRPGPRLLLVETCGRHQSPAIMNEPLTVPALARSVWRDFLRARRALFVYEVLFKLLEAWLFAPAVAVVLAIILSRAGRVAVTNQYILGFLLSPSGLLYAALFGTAAVALLLLEQAGVMGLVALSGSAERPPIRQLLRAALPRFFRVPQLSAIMVVLLA